MPEPVHAIVVIGGAALQPELLTDLNADALLIAADSGLDHALDAGLQPTVLVGDLDSISPSGLAWARANSVEVQDFPVDKDFTDTELALAEAVARGAKSVTLLSGGGDRFDHLLGSITALGAQSLGTMDSVQAVIGDTRIRVVHGPDTATIAVTPGVTFSALALHGLCTGVTVHGGRWLLEDANLVAASSRGLSNIAVEATLYVAVTTGVVTLIFPQHIGVPE